MSRLPKLNIIIATLISATIIIITYFIFILGISTISLPSDFEEVSSAKLNDSVYIYKNHYGIPHIIAKNEEDAFFATGWCHAQDRFWQMDILRRTAYGSLSEIFGKETKEADKFMKIIGLKQLAAQKYKQISKKSRGILIAYTAGVNDFLEKNDKRLPFEFGALNYHPEYWLPEDCLAVQLLLAFSQSRSFWADLTIGEIAEQISNIKALALVSDYPAYDPCILDRQYIQYEDTASKSTNYISKNNNYLQEFSVKDIASALTSIRKTLGFSLVSGASNAFARRRFAEGDCGAVLANDPHFELGLPSRWYQMIVSIPNLNITGATMVGLPLFYIGRSDEISWGITSAMVDDCDFFIEKIDPSNEDFYFSHGGAKKKFRHISDTVYVKNQDAEIFYSRFTDRSGVLSDFLPEHYGLESNISDTTAYRNPLKKYVLTYSWSARVNSDEILSLYKLNRAKNFNQFKESLNNWGSPGLIFNYADKNGNIGVVPAAALPVRGEKTLPYVPNPGWESGYEWLKISKATIPAMYNPEKKFVSSANNKISREITSYISSYWDLSSRSIRIDELMSRFNDFSARDAQLLQIDALSPYARELMQYTFPTLVEKQNELTELEKNVLRMLLNWDFQISSHLASPLIFNTFLERMFINTFKDELGSMLFEKFCSISGLIHRKMLQLVKTQESEWFDNIWTENKETRETIILKSYKESLQLLADYFQTDDFYQWKWGKVHNLTLKHILSTNPFLSPSVTEGTFEMSGCYTTISNTGWKIGRSFEVQTGPSLRFVTDMSEPFVYMSLPGGASGDPLSPNYSDQIQLWLNGGYLSLRNSNLPNEGFKLRITMLSDR